jgi:ribosomal protein S18 acetylase RimI-like enzyme
MTLSLRPMSQADLDSYFAASAEHFIAELIRSGTSEDAARATAAETLAESFVAGALINDNVVFDVLDGDQIVGVLWLGPQSPGTWYVMDIEIRERFRQRGYGRATMLLAEDAARRHGANYLGLNVFGHNPNAHALYESLGYQTQAIRMRKPLS